MLVSKITVNLLVYLNGLYINLSLVYGQLNFMNFGFTHEKNNIIFAIKQATYFDSSESTKLNASDFSHKKND